MGVFDINTYPPILWWSGFIINFFFFSLDNLKIVKGKDRTIADCLLMIIWAGIFATMWPIIDGFLLLIIGIILVYGLLYIIYLPISMMVKPILDYKI